MNNNIDETWTQLPRRTDYEARDHSTWKCFYRRVHNSGGLQVRLVPSNGVLTNPNLTWNGEKLSGNCMVFLKERYEEVTLWLGQSLPKSDAIKGIKATAGTPRKYRAAVNLDMWQPIINLGEFEKANWILAKKKNESPRAVWRNYLLYPDRAVDHKATYYLAWNDERFSKNEHSTALEEHRPELYNVVIEKLKGMS